MKLKNLILFLLFIVLTPAIAGSFTIVVIQPTIDSKIKKVDIETQDTQQPSLTPSTLARICAGITGFYIANPDYFYAKQGSISSQTKIIFDSNVAIATKTKIIQVVAINTPAKIKSHIDFNKQQIAGSHKQKKTLNDRPEAKITSLPSNSPFGGVMRSCCNKIAVTTNTSPNTKTDINKLIIGTSAYTTNFSYNITSKKANNGTTFAIHTTCFEIIYPYISRPPTTC